MVLPISRLYSCGFESEWVGQGTKMDCNGVLDLLIPDFSDAITSVQFHGAFDIALDNRSPDIRRKLGFIYFFHTSEKWLSNTKFKSILDKRDQKENC